MQKVFYLFVLLVPLLLRGQSHNHWKRNFNEESSLLSGAVVGGGAGPAAIFYNPASISEISESKLSVNASLFSFEFLNASNAWGEGNDLEYFRGVVVPRFISYMLKPKKHPKWSLEIAFLNNENYRMEDANSIDHKIDILKNLPGDERYNAFYNYRNKYRDDWLGIGGSQQLSQNLFFGASMFMTIKTLDYSYLVDIETGPIDPVVVDNIEIPFFTAYYREQEYVKFNDYRVLWKFGFLYKKERFSMGINLTTPSVGGIYSDGEKVMRKTSQGNITHPISGEPIPNYLITDYSERNEVDVNAKSAFSIAWGFTWYNSDNTKSLFTTIEYFAGMDPFRMVQANENPDLASGAIFENRNFNEWLTFVGGAKPIFNWAIGYRWNVKENLMVLTGFRTDFNYTKDFKYHPFASNKAIKSFDLDNYHFTGGLALTVLGQDLITGIQYTLGYEKNQKQIINLADPVEYNLIETGALQGTPQNTMNTLFNSISIYFGATINFGKRDN